jgi:hypothetical protein
MGRKWVIAVAVALYTAILGGFVLVALRESDRRLRRELALMLTARRIDAHQIHR